MAILVACALAQPAAQAPKPLDIYFIDVEGGQATLFVTPSGESMLIDTGYPGNGDRDVNRILATMKQAGLTKLDYLLVTHYHNDHVGNAATIAARSRSACSSITAKRSKRRARKGALRRVPQRTGIGRHMLAKPRDKVPIRDLDVTIVTAGGKALTRSGQGAPNPLCAGFTPKDPDPGENAQSVGSVIAFGRFRMLDLGDLTWNKEHELVCPTNLIGTDRRVPDDAPRADAVGSAGHRAHAEAARGDHEQRSEEGGRGRGDADRPQLAGARGLLAAPHVAERAGEANMPAPMIANLDESTAHYIKLSAQRDGAFTVTNSRTKETRTYKAPNLHGRPAAFSDFRRDVPGAIHKITIADLPAPRATRGVNNPPTMVARPAGALPKALPGYVVSEYASGLDNPRLIRTAPNGDLFVAESDPGPRESDSRTRGRRPRADRFDVRHGPQPAVRDRLLSARDRTRNGSTSATPTPSSGFLTRAAISSRAARRKRSSRACPRAASSPGGGHWSRDIAFSLDGRKMYIGVGSLTNVDDPDVNANEKDRATIIEFNPDGSGRRIYATGVRNAVGLAFHPKTGKLWVSVNERDDLGDNLVPDYITHIEDGGFYGWPYYYMGGTQDPRHAGKKPELKDKVITPDVLVQPHSASLQMVVSRRQRVRGAARIVESQPADRLQGDSRAVQAGRHGGGLVRGFPHGLRHQRWLSVGTSGRRGDRRRRFAAWSATMARTPSGGSARGHPGALDDLQRGLADPVRDARRRRSVAGVPRPGWHGHVDKRQRADQVE